jgi:hypothetical protein
VHRMSFRAVTVRATFSESERFLGGPIPFAPPWPTPGRCVRPETVDCRLHGRPCAATLDAGRDRTKRRTAQAANAALPHVRSGCRRCDCVHALAALADAWRIMRFARRVRRAAEGRLEVQLARRS